MFHSIGELTSISSPSHNPSMIIQVLWSSCGFGNMAMMQFHPCCFIVTYAFVGTWTRSDRVIIVLGTHQHFQLHQPKSQGLSLSWVGGELCLGDDSGMHILSCDYSSPCGYMGHFWHVSHSSIGDTVAPSTPGQNLRLISQVFGASTSNRGFAPYLM